jgi:hypothetical protein
VRVPGDVDLGNATVTVNVPAGKDGVTPWKIDIPVVDEKAGARKPAK